MGNMGTEKDNMKQRSRLAQNWGHWGYLVCTITSKWGQFGHLEGPLKAVLLLGASSHGEVSRLLDIHSNVCHGQNICVCVQDDLLSAAPLIDPSSCSPINSTYCWLSPHQNHGNMDYWSWNRITDYTQGHSVSDKTKDCQLICFVFLACNIFYILM